ncbi:GNAT family N-acetyltransferase [candidate division WOR-3 bacterium]|nr:GNAT family N-acetyltransferase [candidate division WOR-3 bacterium]
MPLIRRIREEDWQIYRNIRLDAMKESPMAFSTTYQDAQKRDDRTWKEQVHSAVSGSERCTYLAFDGDKAIGVASIYGTDEEGVGELIQVWVSPDYRGTSTAFDLIKTVLDWASRENYKSILAIVRKDNEKAVNFYIKFGFEKIDKSKENYCLLKEID